MIDVRWKGNSGIRPGDKEGVKARVGQANDEVRCGGVEGGRAGFLVSSIFVDMGFAELVAQQLEPRLLILIDKRT